MELLVTMDTAKYDHLKTSIQWVNELSINTFLQLNDATPA